MEQYVKTSEEFVNFGKGNVDALVKAGQIWTNGVQAIAKELAETTQAHLNETVAVVKSFTAAKSAKELLELQTALARSSVEKAIAESTRLADASTRLATEALAPLTARLTQVRETFAAAA
jgi:phasin family protein